MAIMLMPGACATLPGNRAELARGIAAPAHLVEHDIAAAPFMLRSYEHVGLPATGMMRVYIEGDGLAWLDRATPSPDPTPIRPLALSLAAVDPAPNVIYLARPCQYTGVAGCDSKYWLAARFAPVTVAAMGAALDDIKARYPVRQFELVGISGGGAMAVLVAAQRSDIASIRTVAGNLDTDKFTALHQVSPMTGSLNPRDVAARVAAIPQRHFIGGRDDIVPQAVYQQYHNAANGNDACIHSVTVAGAAHETGWVESWPQLVAAPVVCGADEGLH